MEFIYKLCQRAEWYAAMVAGVYEGSAHDARDGFIHFSSLSQLAETARRHFADASDLVLVSVDPDRLGDGLKWEPSRGGELFPHLYGTLDPAIVAAAVPLSRGANGALVLPTAAPAGQRPS
jgi:uncharacterized protein (DUF952 family)